CSDLLSVVGGMGGVQLVRPGRVLVLTVRPATDGNQRIVSLVAMPPPLHWVERFVLLLTEIAGISFPSSAAWLAWSRPTSMRWVIWGALIGLPAYILSGLLGSTALWQSLSGDDSVPENLFGFLLLVYGILGWFVFEAVRRPRVVNVSIPLRRITAFGLLLSVPALFAHQQIERLEK